MVGFQFNNSHDTQKGEANTMSTSTIERKYYTRSEAAEVLHVSEQTVRRLTLTGELPSIKVGRQVRIPAATLDAWTGTN